MKTPRQTTRRTKPPADPPGSQDAIASQQTSRARKTLSPKAVNLEQFPRGSRTDFYVRVFEDATSQPVDIPLIAARGSEPGPVVGITAAVHGNELNGIKIVHRLLEDVEIANLRGTLLCAPIVNVPAFAAGQRCFLDGRDLNHHFPGRSQGTPAEQYARAFLRAFLPACDALIDIHTASEGRTNTIYVRANLALPRVRRLAELMNPEIILHIRSGDGTLRHAARARQIPAITVEAGNPSVFQGRMVYDGELGIRNILKELGLIPGEPRLTRIPVYCSGSRWLRTTSGGLLETQFKLGERVEKGQLLAQTIDPFGRPLQDYLAPRSGIVIGMAANPAALPGTRFCHLGFIAEPDELRGLEEPP